MFVDFEKAFEMDRSKSIPYPVLEYYSTSLPEGLRYKEVEPGIAVINGFNKISGLVPILSEQERSILGDHPNQMDVLYYAYNTQKEIKLVSQKPGFYILDGKEVAIEKFFINNSGMTIKNGTFFILPKPFAEPFRVEVEGNGCKVSLMIQQQPNESITESKFSNIGDTCFRLTYYVNRDKTVPPRFYVSYQLKNAKNVQEGLESLKLFNAFAMGNGRIGGSQLVHNSISQPISDKIITFWERVAEIERVCNTSFKIKTEEISFDEGMDIERLYQNLILKRPIKDWHQIESLSIPGKDNDIQEIRKNASHECAAFQYETTYVVDILGQELRLPSIACTYNISYSIRKVNSKDEYKITFKKNDQRFTASISFINRKDMEQYIIENPNYAYTIQECVDVKREMLFYDQAEH